MPNRITLDDIIAARERGESVVLETPTLPSTSFSRLAGSDLWLKAENLQRTGSFKIRGGMNALALLPEGASRIGVVAASAGNHAQGVALAAAEHDVPATVFMPISAAIPKVSATRSYGAEVVLAGQNLAETTDHAVAFGNETGATFIHPFDDPNIVAGQGTLGVELLEQVPDVDTVVIPVGGGGLIAGAALAIKTMRPDVHVVGVQSGAVPTYVEARRTGTPREIEPRPTIADGIAVSRPSELCFGLIEAHVDELITVDDHQVTEAVVLLLERAKYLVEPSGAVGVAAVLHGLVAGSGRTAVVLSGGNVDPLLLDNIVRHGLESRGRFASFTITVPDEPNQLVRVLTKVGEAGANVLGVEHHREGSGLAFGSVEISIALETRGHEHIEAIASELRGYQVSGIHPGLGSDSSP